MQEVPLIQYPNQELQCTLYDQDCTIRVYERSGYTYLDLSYNDQTVREGQLVIPYARVLSGTNGFKGNFYVVDTERDALTQEIPQYDGLSIRWKLYYLTPDELAEIDKHLYNKAGEPQIAVAYGYGLSPYGLCIYGHY